nr:MAG TPA: hypothetical protein [Caudoviricetes sp.]
MRCRSLCFLSKGLQYNHRFTRESLYPRLGI